MTKIDELDLGFDIGEAVVFKIGVKEYKGYVDFFHATGSSDFDTTIYANIISRGVSFRRDISQIRKFKDDDDK